MLTTSTALFSRFFFPYSHLRGKQITISFWIRATVPQNHLPLTVTTGWGTQHTVTINASESDTWIKRSLTIGIPENTTAQQMEVGIGFRCTSNQQWVYSDILLNRDVHISQVQIEVGDLAGDFFTKRFEDDLRECQRLYEKSYLPENVVPTNTVNNMFETMVMNVSTAVGVRWLLGAHPQFKVPKMATPTIRLFTQAGTEGQWFINGNRASRAINITTEGFVVANNGTAAVTPPIGSAHGHWAAEVPLGNNVWWE